MAVPNNVETEEKIIYAKEDIVDIAPDSVPVVKGKELIGQSSDGLAGSAAFNIARPYQSPNFVAGVEGWRLNSNGIIQAVGVELSGSIVPEDTLDVILGGTGAQSLTGILKGNGTNPFTAIVPLAGTKVYYTSDSSGGAVTRKLTFQDGVLVSET